MPADRVERVSELHVPPELVWAGATDLAAVNEELRPMVRMAEPPGLGGRRLDQVGEGEPLGRSRILLAGRLPVDYDEICMVAIEPPRRFLERSRTFALAVWEHERLVEPVDGGCKLTDRLGFELKAPLRHLPGAAALATAIVGRLFDHRHRRLRARYGGSGLDSSRGSSRDTSRR